MEDPIRDFLLVVSAGLFVITLGIVVDYVRAWWRARQQGSGRAFLPAHIASLAVSYDLMLCSMCLTAMLAPHLTWRQYIFWPAVLVFGLYGMWALARHTRSIS